MLCVYVNVAYERVVYDGRYVFRASNVLITIAAYLFVAHERELHCMLIGLSYAMYPVPIPQQRM